MALRLYNTMSSQVEEFRPLRDNEVRMYACGPTVYDYGHIGNFRTFLAVDMLQRFLRQSGYKVRFVMNITDLDDKIIRNAARDGVSVQQYTAKYQQAFLEDSAMIGIEQPRLVRATEHIPQMAEFVSKLIEKNAAYRADDGSYYFRIASFPRYGKLSKKDFSEMRDGTRVDVDEYDKDSARDFALWKAPKAGEASWETPIGPGRPGWHLECSVMSMEELGESFDLHAGGEDLIFPHHENEIAQSESVTGKTFARFWFHVRFLLVEGEKMSKSLGNFYTLRDLVLMGHKPSSIRYLLASVPYRNQLNFTFDGLKQAAVSVERLRTFRQRLSEGKFPVGSTSWMAELAEETVARMKAALEDDLNAAEAQAAIFDMIRKSNTALDASQVRRDDIRPLLTALEKFDEIFAVLNDDDLPKTRAILEWALIEGRGDEIGPELRKLSHGARLTLGEIIQKNKEIENARQTRNFKASDELRAELTAADVVVKNTKDGLRWDARYMTKLTPLGPVAIKLNQSEVHAPDHDTWGVVTCESCGEKFALGPNRIYGSRSTEAECVKQLEDILKTDHQHNRPHANSYELEGGHEIPR